MRERNSMLSMSYPTTGNICLWWTWQLARNNTDLALRLEYTTQIILERQEERSRNIIQALEY